MLVRWIRRFVIVLATYLAFKQTLLYFAEQSLPDIPAQTDPRAENVAKTSKSSEFEVKLAIFYDTEFAEKFGNSRERINKYWEVILYDVHLRFQTLPSFKFSFKATSLNLLEKTDQRQIVKPTYNSNDSDFKKKVHRNFQKWSYKQVEKTPQFDVAVLALGTQIPEDKKAVIVRKGTICNGKNDGKKLWANSIAVTLNSHPGFEIARSVAYMLGAPHDKDEAYWDICNYQKFNKSLDCCIMSDPRFDMVSSPHFFSQCTDKVLAKILPREDTSCLKPRTLKTLPVIDSAKLFNEPSTLQTFSMEDQCQLFTQDPKTIVKLSQCFAVECGHKSGVSTFSFAPLEGSPCGQNGNGRCVRALCVEPQVRLVNVGTGKCLVSEHSQFASNDKPVLRDCSSVPFDWNVNPKAFKGGNQLLIWLTYSSEDVIPGYKSLSLTGDTRVGYEARFSTSLNLRSPWWVDRLRGTQGEVFLLFDLATGICARAAEDTGNIQFLPGCKKEDAFARWKLVMINGTNTELGVFSIGFQPYLKQEHQFQFTLLACLLLGLFFDYVIWWWPRRHMRINIKRTVRRKIRLLRGYFYRAIGKRIRRQG